MKQQRLVLVDGHSIIFRAFHALPLLTTRAGQPTNAAYGFTRMLLKVLRDLEPDYLAIALDTATPTFRHEQFADYKANRVRAPDELLSQFPLVDDILNALNIRQLRVEGFEADDILGALAKRFASDEVEVLLVSGDLDVLQVVEKNIHTLITLRGASELKRYDPEAFHDRFGFAPELLPDYKGLRGDTSDNIPGVRGIGDKTAAALVAKYGTVENLLVHLDDVQPKRAREALQADPDAARLGKWLATLNLEVPLDVSLEDCRYQLPAATALRELFGRYEFTSLVKEFAEEVESTVEVALLTEAGATAAAFAELAGAEVVAFLFDYSPEDSHRARGIAFAADPQRACYLPLSASSEETAQTALPGFSDCVAPPASLQEFLASETPKLTHDAKSAHWAASLLGGSLNGVVGEVMLASYLLTPDRQNHPVSEVARDHLGLELPVLPTGKPKKGEPDPSAQQRAEVFGAAAAALLKLHPVLEALLDERQQLALYREVELALVPVLWEMERVGVLVDTERLTQLAASLGADISKLEGHIHGLAGEAFNIGSTQQLQTILFEKLGLAHGKRTKTGYSTSADVLDKLAEEHEIVRKILEYRELTKLKSTYVDGLLTAASPETGRIHTSFNQTGTATGRLSSSEPNLQNIPIRTEAGREIRAAFVAPAGTHVLVCADYSQIELRVLAHITRDPRLVAAFANDQDIHTDTAAQLFAVTPEEVTSEMRRRAKVVNFGIAYGMSPRGLARDLAISQEEATQYILNYFATYPGVQDYMRDTVERARRDGYVTTLLNRRRYLPDLGNPNPRVREFADRTAINTPIQGTAADLMKVAMLHVGSALRREGLRARTTLQVHDELMFECPKPELDALAALVVESMTNAMALEVPLRVEVEYGPNWKELADWVVPAA